MKAVDSLFCWITYGIQRTFLNDRVEIVVAVSDNDKDDYELLMQRYRSIRWVFDAGRSRAQQMNTGVSLCSGDIFWFLHADVLPDTGSLDAIVEAHSQGGRYGWFCYHFDMQDWRLAVNAWFTRYDGCHAGGGDQCIWIDRRAFDEVGRYCDIPIMEDFDIIRRLRTSQGKPVIIRLPAKVSARKYVGNNYWKVNWVNARALWRWRRGYDLGQLKTWYRNQLNG